MKRLKNSYCSVHYHEYDKFLPLLQPCSLAVLQCMKIFISLPLLLFQRAMFLNLCNPLRMRGLIKSTFLPSRVQCDRASKLYNNRFYSCAPLAAASIPEDSHPSILSSFYEFSYDTLPDETIYILDGTSMLFHAYYR